MNVNRPPRPYGPAYQEQCAQVALEAGCKGNEMGLLYCLFHQSGLWNWDTGETVRPISHNDLAAVMGGLNYDTVKRAMAKLRKAGVLGYATHRGRGVKWADGSGHANKYRLLLPPVGASEMEVDPGEKTTRPPVKKQPDPRGKNTQHYHTPYFHKGAEDAPSRREGDKASSRNPSPDDHQRMEAQRVFNRVFNETHDFGKARAAEQEYLAAAQLKGVNY